MLILNETNYSDGKATFRDASGEIVSGGTLRAYYRNALEFETAIGIDGSASFDMQEGRSYTFEIYDSAGVLVAVLDPVLYEPFGSGEEGGGSQPSDLDERVDALEQGLAREVSARTQKDAILSDRVAEEERRTSALGNAVSTLAEKIGDAISYSEFDVYNESDEIVIKKVTF